MADVNEKIRDLIISRQVDTGRHANKVVRDIMALLNDSMDDVAAKIYRKMDKGPRTKGHIDDLLAAIQKLHSDTYAEAYNELKTPLLDFAQHEAAGHAEMLNRAIPVTLDILTPNIEQLKVLVSDAPIQGRLLAEWWASLESSMAVKTAQQIRLGIVGGEGVAEIVKRLAGSAKDYEPGIWSIVRRETEAVVRTAVNHVSNQAAQAVFSANADLIKGVRWTSTLDARTTPICQSRDGVVYGLNEGPRPPAHVNCLPGDSLVLPRSRILAVSKRWYDGDMVIFKTASGRVFTCTPNHPILTPSGWVAAGVLNVGGNVISDGGSEWGCLVDGDNKDVPARIEDIAEAFFNGSEVLSRPVPVSAKNFHGDGVGSKVAVIGADRKLWVNNDTLFGQHAGQLQLVSRNNLASCLSAFKQKVFGLLDASYSIVGGFRECAAFFWCHPRHASKLLFTTVSGWDTLPLEKVAEVGGRTAFKLFSNALHSNARSEQFNDGGHVNNGSAAVSANPVGVEPPKHGSSANPIFFGNIARKGTGFELGNDDSVGRDVRAFEQLNIFCFKYLVNAGLRALEFIGNKTRFRALAVKLGNLFGVSNKTHLPLLGNAPNMDAAPAYPTDNDVTADAVLALQIASGSACDVFVDEIVDYRTVNFHGHVYNLQTESSWYVAQGVVSHNCRSFTIPIIKSWREIGIDLDEIPESKRASMNGEVPADTTYGEWLRKNPEHAKEALGATRAKLFIDGKMDVGDFVTDKGTVYTLDILKQRQSAAFARAFP